MPWPFPAQKEIRSFIDLSPDGLVDLHAHLLPGLDDGPRDLEESAVMLDRLGELGYSVATSTPHFSTHTMTPDLKTQKALAEALRKQRRGEAPALEFGAEIVFDDLFFDREDAGRLPGIAGRRIYLVEFGFNPGSIPPPLEEIVFQKRVRGVRLVLAHPERYPDLQRHVKRLSGLCRAGLILQVDLLSLAGKYGRRAESTALTLLDEGLADLVASDLHRARELVGLGRALERLAERGAEEFVRLTAANPRALLDGRPDEMIRHA